MQPSSLTLQSPSFLPQELMALVGMLNRPAPGPFPEDVQTAAWVAGLDDACQVRCCHRQWARRSRALLLAQSADC